MAARLIINIVKDGDTVLSCMYKYGGYSHRILSCVRDIMSTIESYGFSASDLEDKQTLGLMCISAFAETNALTTNKVLEHFGCSEDDGEFTVYRESDPDMDLYNGRMLLTDDDSEEFWHPEMMIDVDIASNEDGDLSIECDATYAFGVVGNVEIFDESKAIVVEQRYLVGYNDLADVEHLLEFVTEDVRCGTIIGYYEKTPEKEFVPFVCY